MLTADQILSEQYVSVNPGTSVGKAIERMVEENTSIILVASDDYQLIGTLTESVLLRATMDSHLRQDPVSLHMTRRFSSVSRHAPLDVVLDQFDGCGAGVISRVDLLRTVFGSKLENSQIAG